MPNLKIIVLYALLSLPLQGNSQIIANHSIVNDYDQIPQYYINHVKKMLVDIAGESHSLGYRIGQNLLESYNSNFKVHTYDGAVPPYSDQYLRIGRHASVGEATFYTTQSAIDSYKLLITEQNNTGNPFSVIGFGWCWDMHWTNGPGGLIDPVYNVRWAGSSEGGPNGNMRWGLDSEDESLTGNRVCMNTYLDAIEQYISFCKTNGYSTKIIFTTGPVDNGLGDVNGTESGYQRELKHDYIREYVLEDQTRLLFDYADILCWNNSGEKNMVDWNDGGNHRFYANIHPDNMMDYDASWNIIGHSEDGDHIGEVGALRLAKAMWWMLARISGWDGNTGTIPVTGITVSGNEGATTINVDKGTLQLTATVSPSNATNKTVSWSIQNGTGQASISTSGLVTALANGTVTAKATANDGSGVFGTMQITISNQSKPVTSIVVSGADGASTISTDNGQLQLTASVSPEDATDKTVTWSIQNGTGQASINASGLVTAVSNGTVTAKATANDRSGISGTLQISISNQITPVTSIIVSGAGGANTISTNNGQLQLSASISPAEATDKTVTWSVQNGTGQASISNSGLVTAWVNGTVTAKATANDGSGVFGTMQITISNQIKPVTSIEVSDTGGSNTISIDNGQLQLTALVSPVDATDKTVTWSIQNVTGQASISTYGLVTAISNGTVIAKATANDGSGVSGTFAITISNQTIHVSGITVTGAGGSSSIATDNGTLQLSATVTPADATDKTVTWSVQNGTGQATITNAGLVTAITNGTVTVKATANDGSDVSGTLQITISNQVNPVTGISVTGQGGATGINANNGTLQLIAEISPATATDKAVTWSVQDGTGQASINSTGMLTAVSNGTVTARATANDGSGIYGTITITITNQVTEVTGITVSGTDGNTISTDNGQLQMIASVLPADATNKSVTWSVQNGTGRASISSTGMLTAIANGTVSVRASSNDGSGVSGTLTVTISNQIVPVENITVRGENGASIITGENGTLQLYADILPGDASDQSVTWSIQNGTGEASINASGLVTSISNGTVTAKAMANDGTGISGSLVITISDQIIPVSQIIVTGEGGINSISSDKGTLQMIASVSPDNSTDKTVNWTVINSDGQASINSSGLLTAISDGSVTVKATANDGSGIYGILVISISNQKIPVSDISIQSDGSQVITTQSGTLQLSAVISPENASEKSITWTIETGSEFATISPDGLVTAVSDGNITVKAMSNDGSGKFGTFDIQITGQEVLISSIVVYSSGLVVTIDSINGTLQLLTSIYPANASNKDITWSVENITGNASIDQAGLLTAHSFGLVKVRADANDGSGICGILNIQIQGTTPVSNDPEEFLRIITSPALIQIFLRGNNYDHIRIYNVSGDLIISKKINSNLFEMDRSDIPPGIYLFMLTGKKEMIIRKFRN